MLKSSYGQATVWIDSHTRRTLPFRFWCEMHPPGFMRFCGFLLGSAFGLAGLLVTGLEGWPLLSSLVGGAGLVWLARYRPAYVQQLVQQGLVAFGTSCAYRTLEDALLGCELRLGNIHDKADADVGTCYITQYFRTTAEWSRLVDGGRLEATRKRELESLILGQANQTAELIEEAFERRKQHQLMLEAPARAEAERQRQTAADQAAAYDNTRAEQILTDANRGLIE